MTNQQVAFSISKAITDGYINFMTNLLSDCNLPTDLADLPVKFNEPIYGSPSPSFTEFMAPGIIIIIIFFLAVGLTGEAFIAEKLVRKSRDFFFFFFFFFVTMALFSGRNFGPIMGSWSFAF